MLLTYQGQQYPNPLAIIPSKQPLMPEPYLSIMLVFVVLVGVVSYLARHKWPRVTFFVMSVALLSIGVWMLLSTYQLYLIDEAHTFSKHNTTFSKVEAPTKFMLSVVFHAGIGVLLCGVACIGMYKAIYGPKANLFDYFK